MKKILPYILMSVLAAALIMLFITGRGKKKQQKLNERITLNKRDKIPYGTYVAYESLKDFFHTKHVFVNKNEPGYWDSLSNYESNQALIIVTGAFNADVDEVKKLAEFARAGNQVFISAQYLSATVDRYFECNSSSSNYSLLYSNELERDMKVTIEKPVFQETAEYSYPGKSFHSYFTTIDTSITDVLGRDGHGNINFIRLTVGHGHIFVHLEPLAFSNYFILHKNNIRYYEQMMSLLSPATNRIAWDEYYIHKKSGEQASSKKKGWFSVLMGIENDAGKKPFKAAFLLLIGLLLLYVWMEARRKQRYIPVVVKPRNDSLDFVRTIGRLYYDKGDHMNLARKMSAYFLEHVRTKYKLATGELNEQFIRNLAFKSGVDASEVGQLVNFISALDDQNIITQQQLMRFHQQLETFYSKA